MQKSCIVLLKRLCCDVRNLHSNLRNIRSKLYNSYIKMMFSPCNCPPWCRGEDNYCGLLLLNLLRKVPSGSWGQHCLQGVWGHWWLSDGQCHSKGMQLGDWQRGDWQFISIGSIASMYVIVYTRNFYSTQYMYLIYHVGCTAIFFNYCSHCLVDFYASYTSIHTSIFSWINISSYSYWNSLLVQTQHDLY